MSSPQPNLSLRQLEEFDPRSPVGGSERRFLCPLCGESKPRDSAHRSLGLNTQSGAWVCHRCGEKGKLSEWKDDTPTSTKSWQRQKLLRAFSLDTPLSRPPARPLVDTENSHLFSPTPPLLSARADSLQSPLVQSASWRRSLKNLVPLAQTPGAKYLQTRGLTLEHAHAAGYALFSVVVWLSGDRVSHP